jgi:hypothetical protein
MNRALRAVLAGVLPVLASLAGAVWAAAPPSGAVVPAVTAAASVQAFATAGIRPPDNPSRSLAPSPDFLAAASCDEAPNGKECDSVVLRAIAHARSVLEHLGTMSFSLPAYLKLTRPEQLFATVDLERVARGMAPVRILTTSLDHIAWVGATKDEDPPFSLLGRSLPGGGVVLGAGGNWAGGYPDPLAGDYGWMYDDGFDSPNLDCTKAHPAGCWGHRDNILGTFASRTYCPGTTPYETVMGAAYVAATGTKPASQTELIVGVCGHAPTDVVARWSTIAKKLGIK